MHTRHGILGNFKGIGKIITAIALSLGIGAIVLGGVQTQAYNEVLVTNETKTVNLSQTGHELIHTSDPAQGLPDAETGPDAVYDPFDSTVQVSSPENYTVVNWSSKTDVGWINVTNYYEQTTSETTIAIDYYHLVANKASQIIGDGLTLLQDTITWMGVAVIMLFGVIFMRYME